jgi:hypothetical protein
MMKSRVFRIIWDAKDRPIDLQFDSPGKTIVYNGETKTIPMK